MILRIFSRFLTIFDVFQDFQGISDKSTKFPKDLLKIFQDLFEFFTILAFFGGILRDF